MNFIDDTGLTAFHVACAMTDTSVVRSFLQQNVNINASIHDDANFWPGYTPLHFAACLNVENVKLLLKKGSVISKNAAGKTPLDLCMERYSPEIIHSILSCKPEFANIVMSDGSSRLVDILILMKDCDKFNNFLQNSKNVELSVPHDSPLWPGNTLLHLSILMNEKTKTLKEFYESFIPEESTGASQESYNCSEKEELAYWKRIVICLVRGCSLKTKNAEGLTPIHLAFKLRKAKVVDKFLNSCKSDAADPNNLTHFHIACLIGKKSLVEAFLSGGVDVNGTARSNLEWFDKLESSGEKPHLINVRANSTALHLAVIFQHLEIVELLLQNGADVHAPIHHSMKYGYGEKFRPIAQLLFDKTLNLKEVASKQNLTHLHIAAWANQGQAVDKLLEDSSVDVDAVFKYEKQKPKKNYRDELSRFANQTPLYLAAEEKSGDAARSLIGAGADMSKKVYIWKRVFTPFIAGLSHMDSDATKFMVNIAKQEFKGIVRPIDDNGVTMPHVACAIFDLVWAKELLDNGADVNAQVRDYDSDIWCEMTPLNVLVLEAYHASDDPPKNLVSLVELLLEYGADVTIKDFAYTPLHGAHGYANEENIAAFSPVADLLLTSQKSYDVNPTDFNGMSHAHVACVRNNVEIVERFLNNGVDVNHHVDYFSANDEGFGGFSCLHFALANRYVDLARMLINRGANVNAEATNGNRPVHVALIKNCMDLDLLGMLYRQGADFSVTNIKDMTPLMCLFTLENFTLEQLDFFLERSSKFDVKHYRSSEGMIGLAMKNAKSCDRELIFQKLVDTDAVKTAISNGFNAIHSIVSVNQNGCLTLNFYVSAIVQLMKMGCNLDQQNASRRAPIHDAVYFNNVEAIKALLKLGADINIVDTKNKSPLSTSVTIADDEVAKERRSDIITWLLTHAWKIQLLGLPLKFSVKKDMLSLSNNEYFVDDATQSRWQNELRRMENVKISESLTVKSFLYEGVSLYSFMSSSERELVDDFFENRENMILRFPDCSCFLNMQYRKAVLKFKLL